MGSMYMSLRMEMLFQWGRHIICIIIGFWEERKNIYEKSDIVIVFKIITQFLSWPLKQTLAKKESKKYTQSKTGSYFSNCGSAELAAGIFVLDSEIRASRVL